MRTDQARTISIIEYLKTEGHLPAYTRQKGREAWYRSPLRADDDTPSFKVDILINKWFDHGLAEGGNTLDLVVKLKQCTVRDALAILDRTGLLQQDGYTPRRGGLIPLSRLPGGATAEKEKEGKAFHLSATREVGHPALLQYLETRGIALPVARRYLKEIRFKSGDDEREFFALGWPNGVSWEARSSVFKGVVGNGKEINVINPKDGNDCIIFEGFMDFLSFLSAEEFDTKRTSFIILNSLALRERLEDVFAKFSFRGIYLYLDHDESGRLATEYIKSISRAKIVIDKSDKYDGYKDYNAWWMEWRKARDRD